MKTSYYHQEDNRLAVIDLIDYSALVSSQFPNCPPVFLVSRVNTPPAIRGRHIARKLLTRMAEDADHTKSVLILEPRPYPDTNMERLVRLYEKFGFQTQRDGTMLRMPQKIQNEHILLT